MIIKKHILGFIDFWAIIVVVFGMLLFPLLSLGILLPFYPSILQYTISGLILFLYYWGMVKILKEMT